MNNLILSKYEKALHYEIFVSKEYSILDSIILQSNIIYDIGAHIGFFSQYAKQVNPLVKIKCFEPNFNNFEKLKINIGSVSDIELYKFGFHKTTGFRKLYYNQIKSMQTSLYNNTFLNQSTNPSESYFYSFDDYFKLVNYKIDLMKIDIEGAEIDLLLNTKKDIFTHISTLFFEYHIFDNQLNGDLNILLDYLNLFYKNIKIINSKYSNKLGYVLCNN